jgi:hypothetical protein
MSIFYKIHFITIIFIFLFTFITLAMGQNQSNTMADPGNHSVSSGVELHSGQAKPGMVNSAEVTIITSSYTYPCAISAGGDYVVGVPFGGGASYFWSIATGFLQFPGSVNGVSDNGLACGSYYNSSLQYNGNDVQTAGTWDPATSQWTFPGMNPAVPQLFSTDYNAGWDITADGTTIVGMQWFQNFSYSAFKWTQANGYQMIGTGVGQGSRASGISSDGSVIFGWAAVPAASRTPVIWYNSQVYFINNNEYGEAFGASTTGNYVTGELGNSGFLWTPQNTTTFTNTLNSGALSPTTVLNNGTVFGYTYTVPTSRRAFAKDLQGNMITFNDYAEARGLEDAQQWIFYSINDASADGNKLVGAGKTPQGLPVTFLIEFIEDLPVFAVTPQRIDFGEILVGMQSAFQKLVIKNAGTGNLLLNSLALGGSNVSHFMLQDTNTYPISLGQGDSAMVSVAFSPSSNGLKQAQLDIMTNTGNYQVPLTGTGVYGVGITEPQINTVSVFPVPANELIQVAYPGGLKNIKLFNGSGQLKYEQSYDGTSPITFNVKVYSNGIYRLQCTGSDGTKHTVSVVIIN